MGKRKSKRGKTVKNNPTRTENEPEELTRAPHSFVIYRGSVGKTIIDFTKDFRKVMEPFTASSLKTRRKNVLKDFAAIAGPLHVSHLVMFTSTERANYVRFARFPRGPTLTFKITQYCLAREVLSSLKKQYAFDRAFRHFPLVVLNNFSGEGPQFKLMATMFQNMFPTINLNKVNLDDVRRCVLFNYNQEDKTIDFRHYGIRVTPVGLSKSVKKLISNKVPNLSRFEDVSEYILRGDVSESEAEDDAESHVILPQKISSRGNMEGEQSAVKLCELGPRMKLQLIKVEAGLCEGEVIFHELVTKTEEEIALINKRREEKRKLKEQRKQQQEKNKQEKERKKEELKKKSLEGMERKKKEIMLQNGQLPSNSNDDFQSQDNEDESDSEWYRREVGEEPDKDLFAHSKTMGVKRKYMTKGGVDHRNKKHKSNHNREDSMNENKFQRNKSNNAFSKKKWPGENKFSSTKSSSSNRLNQRPKKKVMGSKVHKGRRHR